MGRGKHIVPLQRQRVLDLKNQGLSVRQIADELRPMSRNAVQNVLNYFRKNSTVENISRLPRKRRTTAREDRVIHRLSEADRRKTATDIHKEMTVASPHFRLSVRSIRRRLAEFELNGRVARRKPFVSLKNRRARLAFAKKHVSWTPQQWSKVLFTDETKINRFGSDGRQYVRRRSGEEFAPKCTTSTVKGFGGSIMVWGCFRSSGTGPTHRISGVMDQHVFVDEVCERVLLPFARQNLPRNFTLQQDNDPKHTSRKAKRWFRKNRIKVMTWPSQSPDLNPIENLWNDVKKAVKNTKPSNLNELEQVVKDCWANIPEARCRSLVDSMPRRCAAVIKSKGFPTKY